MENNSGFERYIKDPKRFINEVRDLCYTNDVRVFFRDEEDFYGISMISKEDDKGCILEYSIEDPDKKPFILDSNENNLATTRDCPDVEECFLRFYEMNETCKFEGKFDRGKILEHKTASRRLNNNIIKTVPAKHLIDEYLNMNKVMYLESSQIHFKSAFNWALEEVISSMNEDEKFRKMAEMVKKYISLKYVPGVDNAIDNLQNLKKCFEDVANMISK